MTTNYDDELQRCLDEDLNDDEMRMLFSHMAKDAGLRKDFRSLLALKKEIQRMPDPVNHSQSRSASGIFSTNRLLPGTADRLRSSGIFSTHLSIRVPVFAAILVAVGITGYFTATNLFQSQQKTEYVYVIEMPPVIIKSSYSN
ncbi:MAG: hypothetical protein KA247_08110 [Bacteroidetes bacterium]|jgi:hypothetical protein|nr:hypothetical protein [Bacteroidota bacterium]